MQKTEKTEGREFLHAKIMEWGKKHNKTIIMVTVALYIIFVISFAIFVVSANGGFQELKHDLNDYPEEKYEQLEQEIKSIIVENDGIYPEKLSKDSIEYDISYNEKNDFEGEYTIKLTDDVTVTATIGKDLKKGDLTIERDYKTQGEYRMSQNGIEVLLITLIPLIAILSLVEILLIILLFIAIVEISLYCMKYCMKKVMLRINQFLKQK